MRRMGVGNCRAVTVMLCLSACASRSGDIGPNGCATFDAGAALDTDAIANLAGNFELVLTATLGVRDGNSTRGTLVLRPNRDTLRTMQDPAGGVIPHVVVPYYGTSTIDVTGVGALPLGGADSADPIQPGLLMIQTIASDGSAESLILRVGSDANLREAVRFDGGYTVLRVRYVSPDTVLGDWASGVRTETAAGYFCATRT